MAGVKKAPVIATDGDGLVPDGFYRVKFHGEPGVGAVRRRQFAGGTPFENWHLLIHDPNGMDRSYSFDRRPPLLAIEKRLEYLP